MSPFPDPPHGPVQLPSPACHLLGLAPSVASRFLGLGPALLGRGALMNKVGTHTHHSINSVYAGQGSFLILCLGGV